MRSFLRLTLILIPILVSIAIGVNFNRMKNHPFSGASAYRLIESQLSFGPRTPGSIGHKEEINFLVENLQQNGWKVEIQRTEFEGHPLENVIANRGNGDPWVMLGAHFDSRFYANRDPNPSNHDKPVPGANDGASGVAVLLELSRILPKNLENKITLVFFDLEDQGKIPGWNWILGSRAYASSLIEKPSVVVVVDMVGDKDLNIYQERNSDSTITREIWKVAAEKGYGSYFIPEEKHAILDDHIPFLVLGIPSVVIIDIDYPYFHTISDDISNISAESLSVVGNTLYHWLISQKK